MLTILVAATSFPRWEGDYHGTFIWEGCRALSALGAQIRVVAPHAAGAKTHEVLDGIEIFRPRYMLPEQGELLLNTPGGLPVLWRTRAIGRLTMLPFFLSQTAAIARLARSCDLIHAHWILSAVAATWGASIHRRPVVCTVQGSDVYQAMRMPAVGAFGRHALRNAHKVIALSKSLADAVAAQGIDPQKITIIPNGVDAKMFAPNGIPREPVILFAGSLIQRKGVRTLIEAMALVHRRLPAYKLVLIGDGPLRKDLETRAGESGLSDCVRFTGSLPPLEVAHWMRRSELFVLPSLEEGQGVVLLEALASGTPCVASNIGGIPETLSPEWGVLFPPGDAQALACATLDLLERADRRRNMGRKAASAVRERYEWSVNARRVLDLYSEAMSP